MSSAPEPNFTIADLLAEIADIDQDIDLGEQLTTREIKDLLDLGSMKTTRNRIRPLVDAGVLIVTRVRRMNMAGFESRVPAYAVSPTAEWGDVEDVLTC